MAVGRWTEAQDTPSTYTVQGTGQVVRLRPLRPTCPHPSAGGRQASRHRVLGLVGDQRALAGIVTL